MRGDREEFMKLAEDFAQKALEREPDPTWLFLLKFLGGIAFVVFLIIAAAVWDK